jgi:hypothetical protein
MSILARDDELGLQLEYGFSLVISAFGVRLGTDGARNEAALIIDIVDFTYGMKFQWTCKEVARSVDQEEFSSNSGRR